SEQPEQAVEHHRRQGDGAENMRLAEPTDDRGRDHADERRRPVRQGDRDGDRQQACIGDRIAPRRRRRTAVAGPASAHTVSDRPLLPDRNTASSTFMFRTESSSGKGSLVPLRMASAKRSPCRVYWFTTSKISVRAAPPAS